VSDLVELVESNRFVGREFLTWLWFESEVFETNLRASSGASCALWLEIQITLALDGDEARIKGPQAAGSAEAKQALRQGKLPREARLHAMLDENEYTWAMKADALGIGGLKVPAQLSADKDKYEALYERMQLTETLEAVLEALYDDFIVMRLSSEWEASVVPEMRKWAAGERVDLRAYDAVKSRLFSRGAKKKASATKTRVPPRAAAR
jgi:hypothetical protein